MPGGKGNIKPIDGKQFSSEYQPAEKWTEENALQLGRELIEWLNEKDENNNDNGNIFFEEFLVIIKGTHQHTISYLCKKFTSFFHLIEKAKKIQEVKLYKYGIADRLNASITKFCLINEHGKLSENSKSDLTSNGKELKGLTIQWGENKIDV